MATVVAARLIPWEPGLPGIAYKLDDGTEGCINGSYVWSMPEVKRKLSFVDRRNFEDQMRNGHADTVTQRRPAAILRNAPTLVHVSRP